MGAGGGFSSVSARSGAQWLVQDCRMAPILLGCGLECAEFLITKQVNLAHVASRL